MKFFEIFEIFEINDKYINNLIRNKITIKKIVIGIKLKI